MSIDEDLDALVKQVEDRTHLARRDVEGRVQPIRAALDAYRLACLGEAAREIAKNHQLKEPSPPALSRKRAAERLFELVKNLPEVQQLVDESRPAAPAALGQIGSGSETKSLKPDNSFGRALLAHQPVTSGAEENSEAGEDFAEQEEGKSLVEVLPHLIQALNPGKLILLGGPRGKGRVLPGALGDWSEWIDTSRQSQQAVYGLPGRIKRGGVVGVILFEKTISHKHSEPVVEAVRKNQVALAYAGKGGSAALAQALKAVNQQLGSAVSSS
ncbi:MAG: hypothetical protein MK135_14070 [Polyangiaceae bacterium]|nr:hypothetical protein [Polyangiaceae bacterium]